MTTTVRQLILRANVLYIGVARCAGVTFDIRGVLYGLGPQGRALAAAPHAGIGFAALNLAAAVQLNPAVPERTTLQGAR